MCIRDSHARWGAVKLLRLWFGLSQPVDRRTYVLSGIALMLLKYVIDTTIVAIATGHVWTPLDYLSPFLFVREAPLQTPASWLIWGLGVWTIPFFWIGVSMSIRRAVDAGFSPWIGCLFF